VYKRQGLGGEGVGAGHALRDRTSPPQPPSPPEERGVKIVTGGANTDITILVC
jgi:hypothetical protein